MKEESRSFSVDGLRALAIHFLYAGWIGGVTGHAVGALASVPGYYLAKPWLRPKIAETRPA